MNRRALISNPPYNMKWQAPPFAKLQPRFNATEVPPNSNANFAFILTGFAGTDRRVYLLPCAILSSKVKEEKAIRQWLIESNYVEAVIINPDRMFESTSIGTCILVLDKQKKTATTEMVDLRQKGMQEVRQQNGQFGGSSHENRTYKKTVNVLSSDVMNEALEAIDERKNITGYSKAVSIEEIKQNNYSLLASYYIEFGSVENPHRSYKDIVGDINRITAEKNACKLTINESLARAIGFDVELYKDDQKDTGLNEVLEKLGADKLIKQNYFVTSKNKNEVKFENNSKNILSSVLMIIMQMWKQHIYYLNQEENRYLAELRDALLPELMSGKAGMD